MKTVMELQFTNGRLETRYWIKRNPSRARADTHTHTHTQHKQSAKTMTKPTHLHF